MLTLFKFKTYGRIDDLLIAFRINSPKTFKEILDANNLFGIYRAELISKLDKREKDKSNFTKRLKHHRRL